MKITRASVAKTTDALVSLVRFYIGGIMEYIRVSEAAERWGISVHRVQELCKNGKIEGVLRFGRDWMIPKMRRSLPTEERSVLLMQGLISWARVIICLCRGKVLSCT